MRKNPLGNRTSVWLSAIFVALITFVIYLPALKNGFVNWDDDLYVYENINIESIDLDFLKWSFTSQVASHWHPLTLFSLALDYVLWGSSPWGFHLSNILLHTFNTFLVLILTVELIGYGASDRDKYKKKNVITGVVTAILFGIHPLHVESVAWISERKDTLSVFFYLSSILAYIKCTYSGNAKKSAFYAACLLFYILALMSKPMAVSLPIVLLILDFYPMKRIRIDWKFNIRSLLLEKLPFFALSVLTALLTIWAHRIGGGLRTSEELPFTIRVFTAIRSYIFYLFKLLLPLNLSPLYPFPAHIDLFSFEYISSFLVLVVITFSSIWFLKRDNKLYLSLLLYYIVTLLPVIGIIQVGSQMAADRYTYLPSLGPFILFGLGIGVIFEKLKKISQILIICALIMFLGIMAYKTIKQVSVWQNSISLWNHVIKLFPDSSDTAHYNLGLAYATQFMHEEAIQHYKTTIKINPMHVKAYLNLGLEYSRIGKFEQAITYFTKGIQINLYDAKAYNARGFAYFNSGNYQLAIQDYNEAIKLNSLVPEFFYNRGLIHFSLGNYIQALKDYSLAIELKPKYADAFNNRGNTYLTLGNLQQAEKDFKAAITLFPEDATSYYNLGLVYSELGDAKQASVYYKKAESLGLK